MIDSQYSDVVEILKADEEIFSEKKFKKLRSMIVTHGASFLEL